MVNTSVFKNLILRWLSRTCLIQEVSVTCGSGKFIIYKQFKFLPSSWGNSWQNTAIDVLIPPDIPEDPPSEKAAPMAKPSLMLWRVSPIIIIQATAEIFFRGLLIPSSSLNTERRDKLCLRVFFGLTVVSWGTIAAWPSSSSPLAFWSRLKQNWLHIQFNRHW